MNAMAKDDLTTFLNLLHDFDTAMLVTRHEGELRSRPMAVADILDDGRVRFITRDDSGKLQEIEEDDSVNVAMQGDAIFLSVSGNARLTKDRQTIEATWQKKQNPWFDGGRDDPHVMVLEVIPMYAEYWDRSGVAVARIALDRAREIFGGADERPDENELGAHGRVDFHNRPL
jgi:general stress protein 26